MPESEKEKVKVTAHVDQELKELIDEAMEKLGMKSRPEFIRMALTEKVKKILGKTKKLVKKNKPLATALIFPFFPLEALPVMLILFWIALICYYAIRLVRAESPEEQARAQTVLAGCVIAGALMAIARPIAFWATGWSSNMKYDSSKDIYYIDGSNNKPKTANMTRRRRVFQRRLSKI